MVSSSLSTRLFRFTNFGRLGLSATCSSLTTSSTAFSSCTSSLPSSLFTSSRLACLRLRLSKNLRSCFCPASSRLGASEVSFFTSISCGSATTSPFFSTTIPFSVRLKTRSLSKISLCTTLIGCTSSTGKTASFFSGASLTVSFWGFSCLASAFLSLFRLNLANPPLESPTFSAPPLITRTRGFFSFGSTGVVSSVAIMAC